MPPRRRQLGAPLLTQIVDELSAMVQSDLKNATCRTMQLDGWDKDVDQLINFILSAQGIEEFLGDFNATGHNKDAKFCADLMLAMLKEVEKRYPPEFEDSVVVDGIVTDNPSVHQAARLLVQAQWPKRIFLYSCWLHGISKLVEDVFKLPYFKELVEQHKLIVRKVRRKQWIHGTMLLAQKSESLRQHYTDAQGRLRALTVKRMGETRMGSAYGMLKRNFKLRHAFGHVAADPVYAKKCGISRARMEAADAADKEEEEEEEASLSEEDEEEEDKEQERGPTGTAKKQVDYLEVRRLMKCDAFWQKTKAAIDMIRPIMKVLRLADKQCTQHPIVWPTMNTLDATYSEMVDEYEGLVPNDQVACIHEAVVSRWEYMHDKTHSVAYALNPHYHSEDCMGEQSIVDDLEEVISDFYPELEDQVKAMLEFKSYKNKDTPHWKKPTIWLACRYTTPAEFWIMNGSHSPLLRPIGIRVSQLNHAAGGCERNWSAHDYLCGKRRASSSADTLSKEVYYYMNRRMLDSRQARGKKRKVKVYYDTNGNELVDPDLEEMRLNSGSESS